MTAEIIALDSAEKRVKHALSLVKPQQQVAISTVAEALAWGDSWRRAYYELLFSAQSEADRLQWQILDLRTDLLIEQSERLLEKIGGNGGGAAAK